MKRRFLFLPFAALLAIAGTATAGAAAPLVATNITRLGMSQIEFQCGAGNRYACNYLILTSLCQDRLLDDGAKERTCRYTMPVAPFRLEPGEKKTVANLPSDFLYTMKAGTAPTPDDVLKSPIAH